MCIIYMMMVSRKKQKQKTKTTLILHCKASNDKVKGVASPGSFEVYVNNHSRVRDRRSGLRLPRNSGLGSLPIELQSSLWSKSKKKQQQDL